MKDRRVVLVDDSIVRGTTIKHLVKMLRKAGAREVHIRVSSPPIKHPCYYGMDFPSQGELIADRMETEEIREYLGVDSLEYLTLEELLDSVPNGELGYCTACFSGNYPIPVEEKFEESDIEKEVTIQEI